MIHIDLRAEGEESYSLAVRDDGVGLPADLDVNTANSLGMQLVVTLVQQLSGKLDVTRDDGTLFQIAFKELKYLRRD